MMCKALFTVVSESWLQGAQAGLLAECRVDHKSLTSVTDKSLTFFWCVCVRVCGQRGEVESQREEDVEV